MYAGVDMPRRECTRKLGVVQAYIVSGRRLNSMNWYVVAVLIVARIRLIIRLAKDAAVKADRPYVVRCRV